MSGGRSISGNCRVVGMKLVSFDSDFESEKICVVLIQKSLVCVPSRGLYNGYDLVSSTCIKCRV